MGKKEKNTGAKKCSQGLTTCSEELTTCPAADDTEQYQKRPNGAGHRVYRMPEKEGHPNRWPVLCGCCIESDAINS
jgi:hypothetical protein